MPSTSATKQLALWSNLQVREEDIVKYQQCVFKSYATIQVFGYVSPTQWEVADAQPRDFPYKTLVFYPYGKAHVHVAFHFPIDKATNTVSEQHWSAFLKAQVHPYFKELVQAKTFAYWFSTVESLEAEIETLDSWDGDRKNLRSFVQDRPIDVHGTTSLSLGDLRLTGDKDVIAPTFEAIGDDCLAFCSLYALFTKGAQTGEAKVRGAVANYFSTFPVTDLAKNTALLNEIAGFPLFRFKDEGVLNKDDLLEKFDQSAAKQVLNSSAQREKKEARSFSSYVLGTYRSAMQISKLRGLRRRLETGTWGDILDVCDDHFSLSSGFRRETSLESPQRAKWYKLANGSLASAVIIADQNAAVISDPVYNNYFQIRVRKTNQQIDDVYRFFFDAEELKDLVIPYALCLTNKAIDERAVGTWDTGTVTKFALKDRKNLFYGGDVSYRELKWILQSRIGASDPLHYNMLRGSRYVDEVLKNLSQEEKTKWAKRKTSEQMWKDVLYQNEPKCVSVNVGSGLGVRITPTIEFDRDANLEDTQTFDFEHRFFRIVGPCYSYTRSQAMKAFYDDGDNVVSLGFTYFKFVNVPLDQLVYWASHYNETAYRVADGTYESSFTFYVGNTPLPPICGHYNYNSTSLKDVYLTNTSKMLNNTWTTPSSGTTNISFTPRLFSDTRERYIGSNEYVWRDVDSDQADAMFRNSRAIDTTELVGSVYRLDKIVDDAVRNRPMSNFKLANEIVVFCNSDSDIQHTPARAMLVERKDKSAAIVVTGGVAYVTSQDKMLKLHYLNHYGDDGEEPQADTGVRKKYVKSIQPVIRDVWLALFDNTIPPIHEEAPFRVTQFNYKKRDLGGEMQDSLETTWDKHADSSCPGKFTLMRESSKSYTARDVAGTGRMSERGRKILLQNFKIEYTQPRMPADNTTTRSSRYCWFCGNHDDDINANGGTRTDTLGVIQHALGRV